MPKLDGRNIFLLDGLGATASAFFLGVVLVAFQEHVGMPVWALYALAAWASLYAIYSLGCYRFADPADPRWLRWVMWGNLLYCAVTLMLVIGYSHQLTVWGYAYFLSEMAIVVGLVRLERGLVAKLSAR